MHAAALPPGAQNLARSSLQALMGVIEQPVVWKFADAMITHPGIPI
jgi:hypothetical protein